MAAKGVELASAYVSLSLSTEAIPGQLKKAFSGTDRYGQSAGQDMGRRMAAALSGEVADAGKTAGRRFSSGFDSAADVDGSGMGRRMAADLGNAGTDAGRRWASNFERAAERANPSVRGVGQSAGEDAGGGFMGGFGSAVSALGTKAGPIGAGLTAALGVATIAGKAIGKEVMTAMEAEMGRDLIQAQTGLDSGSMATMGSAAAKAFANNFGPSVQANLEAASAAWQSGLLNPTSTEGAVQQTIEQLNTVSTILGEDIPAVSRAASQMLKTGMAKDSTQAFDLLVKASQSGLNVSGDLLDTVTEYGTQFRKLGLSGADAMGLLSQAVKGGARDTDVAADALKEFSIRSVDGSDTTKQAFESLGFDADQMAAKFAAGGTTARTALGQVLTAVANMKDPVDQSRVMVDLFGTQAEDLGDALGQF